MYITTISAWTLEPEHQRACEGDSVSFHWTNTTAHHTIKAIYITRYSDGNIGIFVLQIVINETVQAADNVGVIKYTGFTIHNVTQQDNGTYEALLVEQSDGIFESKSDLMIHQIEGNIFNCISDFTDIHSTEHNKYIKT